VAARGNDTIAGTGGAYAPTFFVGMNAALGWLFLADSDDMRIRRPERRREFVIWKAVGNPPTYRKARERKRARSLNEGNDTICAEAQPAWPGFHP